MRLQILTFLVTIEKHINAIMNSNLHTGKKCTVQTITSFKHLIQKQNVIMHHHRFLFSHYNQHKMNWITTKEQKIFNSQNCPKDHLCQETTSRSTMSIVFYIVLNCVKRPSMLIDQWPLKSRFKSDKIPTFAVKEKKGI